MCIFAEPTIQGSPLVYNSDQLLSLRRKYPLTRVTEDILRSLFLYKRDNTRRHSKAGINTRFPIKVLIKDSWSRNRHPNDNLGINPENLVKIQLLRNNHQPSHSNSRLLLSNVNTRSIRNKTCEFTDFIVSNKIDVCAVTETWLTSNDETKRSECQPDGYLWDDHPREAERSGGGTGLLYKSTLKVKKLSAGEKVSFEYSEWLIKGPKLNTRVLVIYRPPYSTEHPVTPQMFLEEFTEYMEPVILCKEPLIITGDFNFHVNDMNDNTASKFMDLVFTLGLEQHVKCPTHESGHTLDLIITRSNKELILSEPYADYYISDHAFVLCNVSAPKPSLETRTIHFRPFKRMNTDLFIQDLHASSLCQMALDPSKTPEELDRLVELYNVTLQQLIDKHAPSNTKEITVRPAVPWMNDNIKHMKHLRRKAEREWRKVKSDSNLNSEKRNEFKKCRNECRQAMDAARSEHFSSKVLECAGDQKKLFNLINTLMSPPKCTVYPEHSSLPELANEFGKYFAMKIQKIRDDLDRIEVPPTEPDTNTQNNGQKLTSFKELEESEVRKLIQKAPNKQCASDPIPTWLLKKCIDSLCPVLTVMVNLSLKMGHFPDGWKNALVTPLLKKTGLDLVFSNFRPVSNLPFVSKLVERASVDQLTRHMEEHHPLPKLQSAYRPCHSTETALVKVQSDLLLNMDQQKITLLVMLDLSAAFDTIDHDIMLRTLDLDAGITGSALNWFASYLNRRTQQIVVSDSKSDEFYLKYGVPQGSCLGPIMFTVYAASLFKIIQKHLPNAHGYADDHQLYVSFRPGCTADQAKAIQDLEKCITEVRKWMQVNKLKLNDSKTEFVILGSQSQLKKININGVQVGAETVTPVTSVRNLGVIFDENLTMEKHVSKVCRTAYFHLHNIKGIRKYLTEEAACSIVHAFISSQLDYCNSLMAGLPKNLTAKLQRVQNAAARVVLNLGKYDHITPALVHLHWLPVKHRIEFKVLLIVFKALHGLAPAYISEMIQTTNNRSYSLRSNNGLSLKVPRHKSKTFGGRAFAVQGPTLWNRIPKELRSIPTIDLFKSKLKTYLFTQFIDHGL
jgi:hypothetical protein